MVVVLAQPSTKTNSIPPKNHCLQLFLVMNSPKFKPGDLVTFKYSDGVTSPAVSIFSVYWTVTGKIEYGTRGFGNFNEEELTAYEEPKV